MEGQGELYDQGPQSYHNSPGPMRQSLVGQIYEYGQEIDNGSPMPRGSGYPDDEGPNAAVNNQFGGSHHRGQASVVPKLDFRGSI